MISNRVTSAFILSFLLFSSYAFNSSEFKKSTVREIIKTNVPTKNAEPKSFASAIGVPPAYNVVLTYTGKSILDSSPKTRLSPY